MKTKSILSKIMNQPTINRMKNMLLELSDELLREKKKYVIWGASNTGKLTMQIMSEYTKNALQPEFIIDNYENYWGKNNIYSPQYLSECMADIDVILVCVYVSEQIVEQLQRMGYKGRIVVVSASVLVTDKDVLAFYEDNLANLEAVYDIVEDEQSRKTIETYLSVIKTGDINLWDSINGNSYMKLVDTDVLSFSTQENYVDVGAFTGDTLQAFLQATDGQYSSVLCIEPDRNNFSALECLVKAENLHDAIAYNAAVGKENGVACFSSGRAESCHLDGKGADEVELLALDEYPPAANTTLLKISTNGFEMDVVLGARKLIITNRPQISSYASGELLWKLPLYLKQLVPEYKIYIRHYGVGRQAMICYAKL